MRLFLGQGGNADPFLGDGWADAEAGFRWSLGAGAGLAAEIPAGDGEIFLEIDVNPFKPPGQRQRALRVTVDGREVGADSLEGQGIVAYPLPPLPVGAQVRIALHHNTVPSPARLGLSDDPRALGFMVRSLRLARQPNRRRADVTVLPPFPLPGDDTGRLLAIRGATGLAPRALAETLESLGHNCEFGMVQRHLEAEPLGLLRFAGVTLDDLLRLLDEDFAGLGSDLDVFTYPDTQGRMEFLVRDRRYNISLHTMRLEAEATHAALERQYRTHLPFLGNHLRGRLAEGSHIHVYQRPGQLTQSQAVPLWNRLQARGANALLYVDQDPDLPSGAVEQRGWGLFHGKLDHMAPQDDVGRVDLPAWLSLMANTWRLWQRQRDVVS